MAQDELTLDRIRDAAQLISENLPRTACTESFSLSEITGAKVFLKYENLQVTGAFKERGALIKLHGLSASARKAGVIAMSAGNHAQAVARHAQRLGIPSTIVMPRFTPNVKVERTRGFGASVIVEGDDLVQARACAEQMASDEGLTLVHPYDDPDIICGQGSIALEMIEDVPELDVLLVPVGGGGLISGMAIAAKSLKPDLRVIGVQSDRYASMKQVLAGEPIKCGPPTLAEGIAVAEPGLITRKIVERWVDDIVLVDEPGLEEAILVLLEREKTVVEGAGAAGLAALLARAESFQGQNVGLVLSGGNIDMLPLSSLIERGLARSGRLVRLRVEMHDVPGALGLASQSIGDAQGNIVEVHHQRAFSGLPVRAAEVVFVIQARGAAHVDEILAALESSGFQARRDERDPDSEPNA
ncbi:MAG: threonine ammonia-lyase [Deltaproteobacteria bacterium]|nr:threonine ammonia-lyase [Deltaproteobacteria bacterium]